MRLLQERQYASIHESVNSVNGFFMNNFAKFCRSARSVYDIFNMNIRLMPRSPSNSDFSDESNDETVISLESSKKSHDDYETYLQKFTKESDILNLIATVSLTIFLLLFYFILLCWLLVYCLGLRLCRIPFAEFISKVKYAIYNLNVKLA